MRVLFLTPTLGLGGSERLTVRYASGLRERGHEPAIAYGVANYQREATPAAGIPLFELSKSYPAYGAIGEWVREIRRVVKDFRPEVVHAQSIATALVARLASPRTPLLITMHGVAHTDEAKVSFLLRVLQVTGAHVTAVSDATADGLRRFSWCPTIGVFNAGVDVDRLRAESVAGGPVELVGQPHLCFVGRHTPQKGIDVLLRAMTIVAETLPDVGLTLVGEGPEFNENVALATDLGLGDRVVFTRGVPNAAPYIAAAEAMVLASRWEGLPVVALESLALERPLIATAVNGTPTVVIDGETGWLVPPEDEEALAAAIVDVARSPDEAARRAQAGRELIDARFTVERMLDRLESLLAEQRGSDTRVPPEKSRLYYRAGRAHRWVRMVGSRRRGEQPWQGVRIFGYHRVTPDDDVFGISPSCFRRQMELLAASDVTVIRLSDVLDRLGEPMHERYACVTFDDGYLDNLEHALPVLEEFEIPATIFAIAEVIEGKSGFYWYRGPRPPAITVDHLPALLSSGVVDVQAHSLTHLRLTSLSDGELGREIAGSKEQLERHLPYELTSFCYPGGFYTEREVAGVLDAGFRAGVTTRPGVNHGGSGLGDLSRTMINWRDTVPDFKLKLEGGLDDPSWLRDRLHAARTIGRYRRASTAPTT
jgi:glycosyltransferase involved in cell wall biosynthesis/peptidoglycan/xylan/chitin deacetylase (PgdA/CDA1 family)